MNSPESKYCVGFLRTADPTIQEAVGRQVAVPEREAEENKRNGEFLIYKLI